MQTQKREPLISEEAYRQAVESGRVAVASQLGMPDKEDGDLHGPVAAHPTTDQGDEVAERSVAPEDLKPAELTSIIDTRVHPAAVGRKRLSRQSLLLGLGVVVVALAMAAVAKVMTSDTPSGAPAPPASESKAPGPRARAPSAMHAPTAVGVLVSHPRMRRTKLKLAAASPARRTANAAVPPRRAAAPHVVARAASATSNGNTADSATSSRSVSPSRRSDATYGGPATTNRSRTGVGSTYVGGNPAGATGSPSTGNRGPTRTGTTPGGSSATPGGSGAMPGRSGAANGSISSGGG